MHSSTWTLPTTDTMAIGIEAKQANSYCRIFNEQSSSLASASLLTVSPKGSLMEPQTGYGAGFDPQGRQ